MNLSDKDLAYLRTALDDRDSLLFSNDELDDLYERANHDLYQTVLLGIRVLMMNAVKLETYSRRYEQLDAAEVFRRLQVLHDLYTAESARTSSQVQIQGLQLRPERRRENPYTDHRFGTLPRRRRH